jgi:hypothetical protein
MATIIEKTIGTGGDYASIPLWWASTPADFTTADQIHRGLLLNQEFVNTTTIALSGKTCDATRYAELTAAPGASFIDNATQMGRYDATKGAALKCTASTSSILSVSVKYMRINRLQFSNTSTGSTAACCLYESGAASIVGYTDIDQCIMESSSENSSLKGTLRISNTGSKVRNSIIINKSALATTIIAALVGGASAYNCTFVNISGTPYNYGISTQYITGVMKNCYVGGVITPEDGTIALTKTTCFSNAAATGYSTAPLSTATFANVTAGTHDLRTVLGSALLDVGTTESTYAAYGIYGNARPQGAAYDVGAYELVTDFTAPTLTSPTGTATGPTTATGTVSTNESNGTLFYLVNTSPTATVAAVKAGSSKAVTAAGTQNVSIVGLTASTVYYLHYVHVDSANNTSTVYDSAAFTTSPPPDVTAPVLTSPTATVTGSSTATGSVTSDEGAGTLFYLVDASASSTVAAVKAGLSKVVTATGAQSVSLTGLTQNTTYYLHYVQTDASGNDSLVSNTASFTTQISADVTPPTLTTPSGTPTSAFTATGAVTTNENTGSLYYLANTSATATVAAVKAALSKPVTATGAQSVSLTGLSGATTYYLHFVHTDVAGNDSIVSNTTSFITPVAPDTTAPVLEVPTATATGSTTAVGSVGTNEAGGTLYRFLSSNPTATATEVKAANQTTAVGATGNQDVSFTGLSPSTTYYAHYLQRDAAGNDSLVVNSASFSTNAAGTTGTFKTRQFANNTSTGWLSGTTVYWSWHQNGRIGQSSTSVTFGVGTLASDGTLTITAPIGAGYLMAAVRGTDYTLDQPYYQPGTVT